MVGGGDVLGRAGEVGLRCAYGAGDLVWWTDLERWKSCMLQGATQQVTHLSPGTQPACLPTTTYLDR